MESNPVTPNYSYLDWRREHPEYRRNMARIGRSWWMREFGLRRIPGALRIQQFIRAVIA